MSKEDDTTVWYVRRGATVQGPYPADEIRRYLLLGRLRLTDRASIDERCWHPITHYADLIPEEMRDLGTEAGRARFEAARQAIDERSRDREVIAGDGDAGSPEHDGGGWGRFVPWQPGPRTIVVALIVLVVVLAGIGYYREFDAGLMQAADCAAAPASEVVWSGCVKDGVEIASDRELSGLHAINASLRRAGLSGAQLAGARLDYADLTGARLARADLHGAVLRGADLHAADLTGANLRDADLRHADLRDAQFEGAVLEGAMLGNALWIDGRSCAVESIGVCR